MITVKLAAHITIQQIDAWCKRGGELQQVNFIFFINTKSQDLAFDVMEANKL